MIFPIPPPKGTTHPVVSRRHPVRREDRRLCQEPTFVQVVVDEVLSQELIHERAAPVAADGPNIIGQEANRPMLRLEKQNDRRTGSPFALPESRVSGRREQEGRANAPD